MLHNNSRSLTNEERRYLIDQAIIARQHAYVPYSEFPVGAAILTESGQVYAGCNVEVASYGGTCCGERTAAFKAVSEGEREFRAVAVVTSNGASPCGICRQVLYEFSPEMAVILVDAEGELAWEGKLSDLLPLGFGPQKLAEGQRAAKGGSEDH